MKSFILWLKPSFEGDDGKSSFRRLSAFMVLLLMIYMGAAVPITTTLQLYALIVFASVFLLLTAIVTVDNLITLASRCKPKE